MVTKVSDLRADTRPVDPDVKIPAAVKRAAEAAAKAQAEAYPQPNNDQTPTPAPQPNGDNIVLAEPQAPTPPPGVVTQTGNEPQPPAPAPQPLTPQPPAPKSPIADAGAGDTYETRYKAEYGRRMQLKNTLEQLMPRLDMLENRVSELMQENATLRAAPPAPSPQATPSAFITDKDREEFGPEMLDLMQRVARQELAPLQELKSTTASLADRLNGTTQSLQRSARDAMVAHLDGILPDWRQINNLAEFKAWLALHDPYSGAIRHKMLLDAWEQNDTPRVLQFFKGFVSELAATTPAETLPQPAPAAVQPQKPGLESLAAPGRARQAAGGIAPPTEKQIITTADIAAFYSDIRAGKYRGREAERDALEAELFVAQREGRVVQA